MAALPGIIGLLIFIYMRPHEFVPALENLPFLYLFLGLAVVGFGTDLALGKSRLRPAPQLYWAIALVLWGLFTLAIRAPREVATGSVPLLVCLTFFVVIAHAIQTTTAFKRVIAVIFSLGLFVACVGAHQRFAPTECVIINPMDRGAKPETTGRACVNERDGEPIDGAGECYELGEPGLAYACEHVGFFGTTSIGGGRVRYLGVLTDPNELALATSIAIPFAFAFYEQRKKVTRAVLLLFTLGVVGAEVVFTQSRGGQLVFATGVGAYFIKRFGWKRGAVVGAVLAVPLVLLGGRKGEDADASSLERLEAAGAGLRMLFSSPIWGQGYTQFTEHHPITAHNAYVLSAAEMGLVGAFLFAMMLYVSIKITITVMNADLGDDEEARDLKALAMGMLAAFAGIVVGIFFLSWTYHYVLWIHFGLAGALYGVVRARDEEFVVRVGVLDVLFVAFLVPTLLGALFVYVKLKGAW